jgi:anti-sigma factor RsiW
MWASEGCGEIRHALGVYLLGAISPADRSAVGRHLAGCAGCREELARLAGLPGLLGTVPAADVAARPPPRRVAASGRWTGRCAHCWTGRPGGAGTAGGVSWP